jgi:hypothetical protein
MSFLWLAQVAAQNLEAGVELNSFSIISGLLDGLLRVAFATLIFLLIPAWIRWGMRRVVARIRA